MPAALTRAPRHVEIDALDGISRTRVLTDRESERLGELLYQQRYAEHRAGRAR